MSLSGQSLTFTVSPLLVALGIALHSFQPCTHFNPGFHLSLVTCHVGSKEAKQVILPSLWSPTASGDQVTSR